MAPLMVIDGLPQWLGEQKLHARWLKTTTSQPRKHMKTKRITQSNRLGAYLTATVGTSLLAAVQSNAAIVTIDIGPGGLDIAGINGNASSGGFDKVFDFPLAGGGTLAVVNGYTEAFGITAGDGLDFATAGFFDPTNFSRGLSIGPLATFRNNPTYPVFSGYGNRGGDDFGPDSFMGFKTAQGNYGWLEVTWTGSTNQFAILAGAYEDQPDTAILAGATAVPEPASALSTMAMLASGLLIRRRKRVA